mgnify:CR=1 FL=1
MGGGKWKDSAGRVESQESMVDEEEMNGTTKHNSSFKWLQEHDRECGLWFEYPCDCAMSKPYEGWEEQNPPRVSNRARPKMGVDGKSVINIQRLIGRRGKRD